MLTDMSMISQIVNMKMPMTKTEYLIQRRSEQEKKLILEESRINQAVNEKLSSKPINAFEKYLSLIK